MKSQSTRNVLLLISTIFISILTSGQKVDSTSFQNSLSVYNPKDPCGIKQNPNNIIEFDSIRNKIELKIEEVEKLCFVSGTIYFTGAGFPEVLSTSFNGRGILLYPHLKRCTKGSKIALEKVVFRNKDFTVTAPINKWITIKQQN
jgi:hypothetical protein